MRNHFTMKILLTFLNKVAKLKSIHSPCTTFTNSYTTLVVDFFYHTNYVMNDIHSFISDHKNQIDMLLVQLLQTVHDVSSYFLYRLISIYVHNHNVLHCYMKWSRCRRHTQKNSNFVILKVFKWNISFMLK